MRKTYIILSIFCCIVLFSWLYFNRSVIPKYAPEYSSSSGLSDVFMLSLTKSHIPDIIKTDTVFIYDGTPVSLSGLAGGQTICLWYSPRTCSSCVDEARLLLESIAAATNTKPLLLVSSDKLRDFAAGVQSKAIPNGYAYFLPEEYVDPELFYPGKPCFFTVSSDGTFRYLYFFEPSHAGFNTQYSGFIQKQISSVTTEGERLKQSGTLTDITLSANTVNFGELEKDKPVTLPVTAINSGYNPLVIIDIRSSCNCTVPVFSKKPILSGDSTVIKITYDASETGYFSKRVFIYSNAQNSPYGITITGTVK